MQLRRLLLQIAAGALRRLGMPLIAAGVRLGGLEMRLRRRALRGPAERPEKTGKGTMIRGPPGAP